jgi:ornithine decarboxylase
VTSAPTPHFAFSAAVLKARVEAFRAAFPGAVVYYALKANSDPGVLRTLNACGVCFELASVYELRLVAELGVAAERLLYGTAVKPLAHIEAMAAYGVNLYALDSLAEIDKLVSAAPGAGVFVRVVVDDSGSVYSMSNKFGAPIGQVLALALAARDRGLRLAGLSFNVGSQATDATAWSRGIDRLRPVIECLGAHGLPVPYLNLGGGFPAGYANGTAPSLATIGSHAMEAVARLTERPQLILEPGRGLVAEAGTLVTSVIARVARGGREWLFLDAGVYNALFEALSCQGDMRYHVTPLVPSSAPHRSFALAGPTGDGLDVVSEDCWLPGDIDVGDRLLIHHAGAYSLTFASAFNGFPKPPAYVV